MGAERVATPVVGVLECAEGGRRTGARTGVRGWGESGVGEGAEVVVDVGQVWPGQLMWEDGSEVGVVANGKPQ